MKKVKFLSDYQGVLTEELWFEVGDKTELPDEAAKELKDRGIVQYVAEAKVEKKGKGKA